MGTSEALEAAPVPIWGGDGALRPAPSAEKISHAGALPRGPKGAFQPIQGKVSLFSTSCSRRWRRTQRQRLSLHVIRLIPGLFLLALYGGSLTSLARNTPSSQSCPSSHSCTQNVLFLARLCTLTGRQRAQNCKFDVFLASEVKLRPYLAAVKTPHQSDDVEAQTMSLISAGYTTVT